MTDRIATALSIAGSDPSGGAGIQADLKTFSALGVYGMSAITALTAQNTNGVQGAFTPPVEFLAEQLHSIFSVMRVDAVKIGMLATAEIIHTVADILETYEPRHVVLDPVMVAKSGDALLHPDAVHALKERLIPRVDLITPNLPETAVLLDAPEPRSENEMIDAAFALQNQGARNVLIKGGHLSGTAVPDVLAVSKIHVFPGKRVITHHTHGTGCTLSSAITSFLARGLSLPNAVEYAKKYVYSAIAASDALKNIHTGKAGPLNHFFEFWSPTHE
jgi:hydroxymethylpyrimidine/phosphomethylpyrimidine kinase